MPNVEFDPNLPAAAFPTHMLREIYEQPEAIAATLDAYLDATLDDHGSLRTGLRGSALAEVRDVMRPCGQVVIAASGSSRHAGLAGEIMLEDLTGLGVDVEYASEYASRSVSGVRAAAVIVISQSGETADTLAALRLADARDHKSIAIANVARSTMAREATASMPTFGGSELAIPATKSFVAQLAALYVLTLGVAEDRNLLGAAAIEVRCAEARSLSAVLARSIPEWDRTIAQLSPRYASARTLLYLGRGIHYAIAREGALKMKESSYIHAEGYPAGELKHGPNALVSDLVPLVVLATRDPGDAGSDLRYRKTLQLLRDLREQGASLLVLANEGDDEAASLATDTIVVPAASEYLLPMLEVVPLQILAHHCARNRGIDVDRPRNLVKAVVQE